MIAHRDHMKQKPQHEMTREKLKALGLGDAEM